MSYKQIAERLVLSHRTMQNHVQNTLRKLQMNNRVQLTRWAIEHGLDDGLRPDLAGALSPGHLRDHAVGDLGPSRSTLPPAGAVVLTARHG